MRHLSCNLFAIGGILVCVPASAQTLSSLTIAPSTFVGGQRPTATVALSASAGAGGATCKVTSLSPTVVIPPPQVVLRPGSAAATFPVQTLPTDTAISTFVGVDFNGSTQWTRLTVFPRGPFYTRLALFRPDSAQWVLRDNADGSTTVLTFGQPGDQPLPTDYLEGNGQAQVAVFRQRTHEWLIRRRDGTITTVQFGQAEDGPAPADYLGLGRAQIAVFRPGAKQLLIRTDAGETITVSVPFGQAGDQPVSGSYLGLDHGQFALFRPSTFEWIIRSDDGSAATYRFGQPGDLPAPANYLGTGRTQIAVFRPGTGEWFIRADDGVTVRVPFGAAGDVPIQGDYLGYGRALVAVFRPSTGEWLIRNDDGDTIRIPFGSPGDQANPNFYAPHFGIK